MKAFAPLLAFLLILAAPCALAAGGGFRLVKETSGISLYERWISSRQGGQVRELKAVFTTTAGTNAILALLRNEGKGTRWNCNASTYKVLPAASSDAWITYIKYDLPYPMDDQDCCLAFRASGNPAGLYEIFFQSTATAAFPATDKAKRISGVSGNWRLERLSGNSTRVTYTISSDKNKDIPRWLADRVVHQNLVKTLSAFRGLLQ